jgi:hypothetical protein
MSRLTESVRNARRVLVRNKRIRTQLDFESEEDRFISDVANRLFTQTTPSFVPADQSTVDALDFVFSDGYFCTICQEEGEGRAVLLECNHEFHEECIKNQLRVNGVCPNCRRQVGHLRAFGA